MELQPLDFVLLGGVILLAGIGLFRGLSGELGSVAGFAAATFAGFCLLDTARTCATSMGIGDYAMPAAYVIDFVFALVAFGLARWIVAIGLLTGIGLMRAGTYSTGFFATHSAVVREIAAWADANLAEPPQEPEEP